MNKKNIQYWAARIAEQSRGSLTLNLNLTGRSEVRIPLPSTLFELKIRRVFKRGFFYVGPFKRTSFWPPSVVYISVIRTHYKLQSFTLFMFICKFYFIIYLASFTSPTDLSPESWYLVPIVFPFKLVQKTCMHVVLLKNVQYLCQKACYQLLSVIQMYKAFF